VARFRIDSFPRAYAARGVAELCAERAVGGSLHAVPSKERSCAPRTSSRVLSSLKSLLETGKGPTVNRRAGDVTQSPRQESARCWAM
jgi:hypothetical protein